MSASLRGHDLPPAARDLLGTHVPRHERFGRHLPYVSALRDDVILTRQGDLMASIVLDGIDGLTADEAAIDELSGTVARMVGQLGERFGVVVHRLARSERVELPEIEDAPFAAAVDGAWRQSLGARDLKRRVLMLSVLLRPSLAHRLPFGLGRAKRAFRDDCAARVAEMDEAMGLVVGALRERGARRLCASSGEWLALLTAVHGQDYARVHAAPGDLLAEAMTNFEVTFDGGRMRLHDGVRSRVGAIFGIKSYPPATWPAMLDGLELPYDVCVTNSFTPRRTAETLERIQRVHRQRGATEDAGVSLTEQLVEAADEVASGRLVFGDHHASIQVWCDDEAELERAVSEIWRVGQEAGMLLVREGWAARALYFAQAPGNWGYRIRSGMVSADNFAEMAALHAAGRGRGAGESPWGAPVTGLPTVGSTLYRFNFHERGRADAEPSVGHTLVLGRTGSGKTLLTAFLLAQARRLNARVVVIDKDQGLEMAVRALGGRYGAVKVGRPTGLHPFATETDARGEAWLAGWLADLLARHRPLEPAQTTALAEAVRQIVRAEPALRSFDGLASLVASTDDEGELAGRVREWTAEGRHGWVFSRPGAQAVHLDEDVIGIDMSELLDLDAERAALLSYLFRRVERTIEDRRPTLIVIDEAWKMMADPIFVRRLHDWLVTMRKRNACVVMLTQAPEHLARSEVGAIIAESVATQVLFPNPRAAPEDWRILRLGEREAEILSEGTGGRRLALIRSGGDSVVVDADLSGLGPLMTVLGGGRTGEERAPHGWRTNPDFWKEMVR